MEKFPGGTPVNASIEVSESENQKKLAMEYIMIHENYSKNIKRCIALDTLMMDWEKDGDVIVNDDPVKLAREQLSDKAMTLMKQYSAIGEQLSQETKEKYLTIKKDAEGNEFGHNSNGDFVMIEK